MAGRTLRVDLHEQAVGIAVVGHGLHVLDVAARGALVPQLAAAAAPKPGQVRLERQAQALEGAARQKFLNDYTCKKADEMIARWRQLAFFLIVRHNDMAVRPVDGQGNFKRNQYGLGERVERPGYPDAYKKELINLTGDKLLKPAE